MRARVQAMFNIWENVASASIGYERAGPISNVGGFSGGDLNTEAEFNAVMGDCNAGNQSPIIYDAAAAIFIALGVDETSVIGQAGPCGLDPAQGHILTGHAVMNGLFQDGQDAPVPDLDARGIRRDLHPRVRPLLGLDHSQINVECASASCAGDDLAGLPTMFPFLVSDAQGSLSIDDVAWISKLYPSGSFATTHGTITGTVFFSDGESHAQLVNVVARRVDIGGTPADENRTLAVSGVSGNRFRIFSGNPINEPDDQPLGPFRNQVPTDIGFYEIPLPVGSYTIEVETIDPQFVEGSSVGGEDQIAMPGIAPRRPALSPSPPGRLQATTSRLSTRRRASTIRGPVRRRTSPLFGATAAALAFAVIAACGGGGDGGGGGGPLSITTTTANDGVVGSAYSQAVASTGGSGAKTFSISAGTLPAGLAISAAGVIRRHADRPCWRRELHRGGHRFSEESLRPTRRRFPSTSWSRS